MTNPGSNNTVTIEYPDNWPGPEAGTTATVDVGASPAAPGSPAAGRGAPTGPPVVVSSGRTPAKPSPAGPTRATAGAKTGINIPKEIKSYVHGDKVDLIGIADKYNSTGNQKYLEAARQVGIDDQDFEAATKFARDHVKIGKNDYIPVDNWNQLPTNIQDTFRDKGYQAGQKAISREMGKAYAADLRAEHAEESRAGASKALEKYADTDGYDIARYLRDNPQGDAVLKGAGFTKSQIEKARQANEAPINAKSFIEQYFNDRGWSTKAPKRSLVTKKADYETLLAYDKRLVEAGNAYKEKFGTGAFVSSGAANTVKFAFLPARAMAPDVKIKDIEAWEWVIGGAQLALLATPIKGIPFPVAKGMQTAATGVFVTDTVTRWDKMSTTGKAVSVGIDTILLASLIKTPIRARAVKNKVVNDYLAKISPKVKGNISKSLDDAVNAIAAKDVNQLKAAAQRLQLAGRTTGGELGAAITERGRIVEANASRLIKTQSDDTLDILKKSISDNENFIDTASRGLRRATDKNRKAAIEKALKEAQRQLEERKKQIAVKEKAPEIKTKIEVFPEGKYLPAKPGTSVKSLTTKAKTALRKSSGKVAAGSSTIPIREFVREPGQIAKAHNVTETEIVYAVSTMPLRARQLVLQSNPEIIRIAETMNIPAINTAIKEALQAAQKQKVSSKIAPVVLPKVETKPATETAPLTKQKIQTKPATAPQTRPVSAFTEPASKKTSEEGAKPKPKPGKGASDKAKRAYIKAATGAVAWRQGEVGGRDVWHVLVYPYKDESDYMTVTGRKPAGAKLVRGRGSASKTATVLYGKPPAKNVSLDMGAQDVTITPRAKVTFTPDPKQLTRGDIDISKRAPFPLSKTKYPKIPKLR